MNGKEQKQVSHTAVSLRSVSCDSTACNATVAFVCYFIQRNLFALDVVAFCQVILFNSASLINKQNNKNAIAIETYYECGVWLRVRARLFFFSKTFCAKRPAIRTQAKPSTSHSHRTRFISFMILLQRLLYSVTSSIEIRLKSRHSRFD